VYCRVVVLSAFILCSCIVSLTSNLETSTLHLHDALPIYEGVAIVFVSHHLRAVAQLCSKVLLLENGRVACIGAPAEAIILEQQRSEEHTSELQSHLNIVCRLLLEKNYRH